MHGVVNILKKYISSSEKIATFFIQTELGSVNNMTFHQFWQSKDLEGIVMNYSIKNLIIVFMHAQMVFFFILFLS